MAEPTTEEASWPELHRVRRAIVVVDVVESVRLMQANEADFIERWRRFVHEVRTVVLPKHGGRMVKSLGDGMLLAFERVPAAVAAALEIQRQIDQHNSGRGAEIRILLRVGAHVGDVVVDDLDIYGRDVNLAARVATLAKAGEIVVTSAIRDELVQGLDVDIEDIGECYVKHLDVAVRAFRVGPASSHSWESPTPPFGHMHPTVAVLPFKSLNDSRSMDVIGDVLVNDLIASMSRSDHWNVQSRLSSEALKGMALTLPFPPLATLDFARRSTLLRR